MIEQRKHSNKQKLTKAWKCQENSIVVAACIHRVDGFLCTQSLNLNKSGCVGHALDSTEDINNYELLVHRLGTDIIRV